MPAFYSRFSGQEIDQILGSVGGKLNKDDLVTDNTLDLEDQRFDLHPVAYAVIREMKKEIKSISGDFSSYLNIKGEEQDVFGKKTFKEITYFQQGAKFFDYLTLTKIPVKDEHAVPYRALKEHGLADETPLGSAMKLTQLDEGFLSASVDISNTSRYTISEKTIPTDRDLDILVSNSDGNKHIKLGEVIDMVVTHQIINDTFLPIQNGAAATPLLNYESKNKILEARVKLIKPDIQSKISIIDLVIQNNGADLVLSKMIYSANGGTDTAELNAVTFAPIFNGASIVLNVRGIPASYNGGWIRTTVTDKVFEDKYNNK